jgi:hypothetical protein
MKAIWCNSYDLFPIAKEEQQTSFLKVANAY